MELELASKWPRRSTCSIFPPSFWIQTSHHCQFKYPTPHDRVCYIGIFIGKVATGRPRFETLKCQASVWSHTPPTAWVLALLHSFFHPPPFFTISEVELRVCVVLAPSVHGTQPVRHHPSNPAVASKTVATH
jgi:hypothetical protein